MKLLVKMDENRVYAQVAKLASSWLQIVPSHEGMGIIVSASHVIICGVLIQF